MLFDNLFRFHRIITSFWFIFNTRKFLIIDAFDSGIELLQIRISIIQGFCNVTVKLLLWKQDWEDCKICGPWNVGRIISNDDIFFFSI